MEIQTISSNASLSSLYAKITAFFHSTMMYKAVHFLLFHQEETAWVFIRLFALPSDHNLVSLHFLVVGNHFDKVYYLQQNGELRIANYQPRNTKSVMESQLKSIRLWT
jgi:hypothetical protein